MDEFNTKILNRLMEECEDVETYAKLSEQADEKGYNVLATKLESIAYDEYTHAYALKTCLERWGYDIGATAREKFERATVTFKSL